MVYLIIVRNGYMSKDLSKDLRSNKHGSFEVVAGTILDEIVDD